MTSIQQMLQKIEKFHADLLNLSQVPFTQVPDKDGMIDKACPAEACGKPFKVNQEDWTNIFKDEVVYCPFCRKDAPAKEFQPSEQRAALVESIRGAIMDDWYEGIPMTSREFFAYNGDEFSLKITCEKCAAKYAVVGGAFFCPCCWHHAVRKYAKESIEQIEKKVVKLAALQQALEAAFSKDEAAEHARKILEHALTECIGTLQSYSETRYNELSAAPAPFNVFQQVEKSNRLWKNLRGEGFDDWLTSAEIDFLFLCTQKRHLLEHKGGIVDRPYLDKTGDTTYQVQQRLVINVGEVTALTKIVIKIMDRVELL